MSRTITEGEAVKAAIAKYKRIFRLNTSSARTTTARCRSKPIPVRRIPTPFFPGAGFHSNMPTAVKSSSTAGGRSCPAWRVTRGRPVKRSSRCRNRELRRSTIRYASAESRFCCGLSSRMDRGSCEAGPGHFSRISTATFLTERTNGFRRPGRPGPYWPCSTCSIALQPRQQRFVAELAATWSVSWRFPGAGDQQNPADGKSTHLRPNAQRWLALRTKSLSSAMAGVAMTDSPRSLRASTSSASPARTVVIVPRDDAR